MKTKKQYNIITIFYTLLMILFLFNGSACVTLSPSKQKQQLRPSDKGTKTAPKPLTAQDRERLSLIARSSLGHKSLVVGKRSFRADCSGTIRAIFYKAKLPLGGIISNNGDNDVKAIYRYVKKYGRIEQTNPEVGDLVFFHNTYDKSRSGELYDALTHIGIIEKISDDTVYFIHYLGRSIIRSRMNLKYKDKTKHPESKEWVNHILRRAKGKHRAYNAAELFAGFGKL